MVGLADALAHGADVNARTGPASFGGLGWTAAHAAAAAGHTTSVEMLLLNGADCRLRAKGQGYGGETQEGPTPLDLAEIGGHHAVARVLRAWVDST